MQTHTQTVPPPISFRACQPLARIRRPGRRGRAGAVRGGGWRGRVLGPLLPPRRVPRPGSVPRRKARRGPPPAPTAAVQCNGLKPATKSGTAVPVEDLRAAVAEAAAEAAAVGVLWCPRTELSWPLVGWERSFPVVCGSESQRDHRGYEMGKLHHVPRNIRTSQIKLHLGLCDVDGFPQRPVLKPS